MSKVRRSAAALTLVMVCMVFTVGFAAENRLAQSMAAQENMDKQYISMDEVLIREVSHVIEETKKAEKTASAIKEAKKAAAAAEAEVLARKKAEEEAEAAYTWVRRAHLP